MRSTAAKRIINTSHITFNLIMKKNGRHSSTDGLQLGAAERRAEAVTAQLQEGCEDQDMLGATVSDLAARLTATTRAAGDRMCV